MDGADDLVGVSRIVPCDLELGVLDEGTRFMVPCDLDDGVLPMLPCDREDGVLEPTVPCDLEDGVLPIDERSEGVLEPTVPCDLDEGVLPTVPLSLPLFEALRTLVLRLLAARPVKILPLASLLTAARPLP